MHEIAFCIGSYPIRSYGVMAAIGFLAGVTLVNLVRAHANMNSDQASGVVFWAMVGGIIGARLNYVIQFHEQYAGNFWGIFRIDQGGLVFYGGFFLAIVFIYLYCRKQKLDVIAVFDTFAPALAVAHACGRIGCFLNGCCWGKATEAFCAVHYPVGSMAWRETGGKGVYPVQLFEAGILLLLAPVYFYLAKKKPRGVAAGVYCIGYGVLRFLLEFFRGDNARHIFTLAQWTGLGLVPVGVAAVWYFLKHDRAKEN